VLKALLTDIIICVVAFFVTAFIDQTYGKEGVSFYWCAFIFEITLIAIPVLAIALIWYH